jgi:hypothetical protein
VRRSSHRLFFAFINVLCVLQESSLFWGKYWKVMLLRKPLHH